MLAQQKARGMPRLAKREAIARRHYRATLMWRAWLRLYAILSTAHMKRARADKWRRLRQIPIHIAAWHKVASTERRKRVYRHALCAMALPVRGWLLCVAAMRAMSVQHIRRPHRVTLCRLHRPPPSTPQGSVTWKPSPSHTTAPAKAARCSPGGGPLLSAARRSAVTACCVSWCRGRRGFSPTGWPSRNAANATRLPWRCSAAIGWAA